MNWLKTILNELLGLFVDDVLFAGLIVAWLVLSSLFLPQLSLSGAIRGGILFAGLAVILIESSVRKSRR